MDSKKNSVEVTLTNPMPGYVLPSLIASDGTQVPLDMAFGLDADNIRNLSRPDRRSSFERSVVFCDRYFWIEVFYIPYAVGRGGNYYAQVVGDLVTGFEPNATTVTSLEMKSNDGKYWVSGNFGFQGRNTLIQCTPIPRFTAGIQLFDEETAAEPVVIGIEPSRKAKGGLTLHITQPIELFIDYDDPEDDPEDLVYPDEERKDRLEMLGSEFEVKLFRFRDNRPEPYRLRLLGPLTRSFCERHVNQQRGGATFLSDNGEDWWGYIRSVEATPADARPRHRQMPDYATT